MTSLVTEVLLHAGQLDKDDLRTKISKLSSRSSELKNRIDSVIKKKYGEFNPMFMTCQSLQSDIVDQQQQAKEIQETLSGVVKSQLQDSTSEFERLTEEHSHTNEVLFAMEKCCQLVDLFDNYTNSTNDKNFKESAASLMEIQSILKVIDNTHMCDIEVFKFLKRHFILILEEARYDIDERWKQDISWILPTKDGCSTDVILKVPFLEKNGHESDEKKEFQDFIYAAAMLGRLQQKVQKFSELVMKHIMSVLINDHSVLPEFDVEEGASRSHRKITLAKLTPQKASSNELSNTPAHLFQNTVKILHCLHANQLCFITTDEEGSLPVMSIFSKHIRDELLQLLIDKCLALTIPKNMDELENYKEVEDVVKIFESALVSIDFLPRPVDGETSGKLMSYAMNVSYHFANQRCTDILQQARAIMKKEIHNTQLVSEKSMGDLPEVLKKSHKITSEIVKMPVGTEFDSQKPSKLLSDDTLHFPECHVSVCAIDLMKLAYKTMNEAAQSEPGCAVQLVSTTQNIFELYYTAYPIFHKESLENLPQFSAVFHNDCMYLAHHLLTFGHQFSTMSPHAGKLMRVMTFVDKVPLLRRLGAECLLKQMRKQKDSIMQCLEPFRTFTVMQAADKYNVAEKSIKQILYLLNHLKKIWSEVLKKNTLHRALCTLVNSTISELITIICNMEDISADDSISLKLVCILISDQIPLLFGTDTEENQKLPDFSWQKQVQRWSRLQELILMLSGSLREIVDRWSEGKGPLALAFSITEVKGLIRALFQNTEHRAEAITKIRL